MANEKLLSAQHQAKNEQENNFANNTQISILIA